MFHVAVNLYLWICILALNYLKSSAASNRETLILQVVFRLLRRVFFPSPIQKQSGKSGKAQLSASFLEGNKGSFGIMFAVFLYLTIA